MMAKKKKSLLIAKSSKLLLSDGRSEFILNNIFSKFPFWSGL